MIAAAKASIQASQDIVPVEEIRDGVVILSDGSLRSVLMASSINFALKSPDEQDAVILQYQNFLNSLDFPVQFFIESRKLNIEPYLNMLRERKKQETNELLRIQITEYITFVKEFVESSNIVTKTFYIIVPFSPISLLGNKKQGVSGILSSLFGSKAAGEKFMSDEQFQEHRTQLWQRVETVVGGLVRTGVRAVPLNTEELIELYYSLYRPEEADRSRAPKLGGENEK
ncbi:MAG: hypothetical protein HY470_00425 [Candidatus Ryanbacteria bacterium]|nr:hypothetical protein [Candidatus Ryanbacteria bacterium]